MRGAGGEARERPALYPRARQPAVDQGRVWDSIERNPPLWARPPPRARWVPWSSATSTELTTTRACWRPVPGSWAPCSSSEDGATSWISSTGRRPSPRSCRSCCAATRSTCRGRPRRRHESLEEKARSFLHRIIEGTYDDHPAVGLGRDVGVVGEGLVAGALVSGRTVVHLTAFAEPVGRRDDSARDETRATRYAGYRQRLDSLRRRYER